MCDEDVRKAVEPLMHHKPSHREMTSQLINKLNQKVGEENDPTNLLIVVSMALLKMQLE